MYKQIVKSAEGDLPVNEKTNEFWNFVKNSKIVKWLLAIIAVIPVSEIINSLFEFLYYCYLRGHYSFYRIDISNIEIPLLYEAGLGLLFAAIIIALNILLFVVIKRGEKIVSTILKVLIGFFIGTVFVFMFAITLIPEPISFLDLLNELSMYPEDFFKLFILFMSTTLTLLAFGLSYGISYRIFNKKKETPWKFSVSATVFLVVSIAIVSFLVSSVFINESGETSTSQKTSFKIVEMENTAYVVTAENRDRYFLAYYDKDENIIKRSIQKIVSKEGYEVYLYDTNEHNKELILE